MLNWNEFVQDRMIKYSDKTKQISKPLLDHFGITFFYHYRINNQGHYIGLMNRPEWVEYYSSEKLFLIGPYFKHPNVYRSSCSLMEATMPDYYLKYFQKTKIKFNWETSVIFIQRGVDFVDCSVFCGDKLSCLDRLHANNPFILKAFANHFKKEAAPILKKLEESAVSLPALRGEDYYSGTSIPPRIDEASINAFLADLKMAKEVEKARTLSNRETQCLKLLLQGKSAYETANDLNLSSRTVEFYFENIKNKLTCQSKHDLFFIAKDLEGLGLL